MRKLCLITKTFPFGSEEKAFLQYEAALLEQYFDLTVVAAEPNAQCEKDCLTQYKAVKIEGQASPQRKLISAFLFLCKREAWEEILSILRNKRLIGKRLFRAVMFGAAAETFWKNLKSVYGIHKGTNACFYFYWWDYKCLGITMHKKKYPGIRIVTRTHGYDLYDERELYGKQFFKKQMERNLDKIFFISDYGKQYYMERYGRDDEEKYVLCRLGVPAQNIRWGEESKEFVLVSCSNVIPLKRIELIIQGLSLVKETEIRWVHFGDGEELENMKEMAGNLLDNLDNISYRFMGRVDNTAVLRYYQAQQINCFITTTSTEGNPVSVQEALSFGIPVIGTAVSDIPHMVCGNGYLLPQNPTPGQVANAIMSIALASPKEKEAMKKKSYDIWKRDYNAEKNYAEFIRQLTEVCAE